MAIQLSMEERDRPGQHAGEERKRGEAAVWLVTQLMAMVGQLGQAAAQAFERIRRAQARGGKRKQMKLVESLQLGNRRQLLLVVCDNQRYLVGAGADSVGSILSMGEGAASRDRAATGPELVRRRGRDVNLEAGSKATAGPGPDLWH